MKDFNEDEIGKLYREYMKDEICSAEVERDKALFIKRNFKPVWHFELRPAVTVPVMSFCLMVVMIALLVVPQKQMEQVPVAAKSAEVVSAEPALPGYKEALDMSFDDTPVLNAGRPQIEVKRLTSQMGDTMFYQSLEKEVPLTVVWVFPRGGEVAIGS